MKARMVRAGNDDKEDGWAEVAGDEDGQVVFPFFSPCCLLSPFFSNHIDALLCARAA